MRQSISAIFSLLRRVTNACLLLLLLLLRHHANAQQYPFIDLVQDDAQLQASIERYLTRVDAGVSYRLFIDELLASPGSSLSSADLLILQNLADESMLELAESHRVALTGLCTVIAASDRSPADIADLGTRFDAAQNQREQYYDAASAQALSQLSPAGAQAVEERWLDFSARQPLVYMRLDMTTFARDMPDAAYRTLVNGCDSFLAMETGTGDKAADSDTAAADSGANTISGLRIFPRCNPASTSECTAAPAIAGEDATGDLRQSANLEGQATGGLVSVTGIIYAAADGVLSLQTDTDQYINMVLPADVAIERHTPANLDDLRTGDIVGAVVYGNWGQWDPFNPSQLDPGRGLWIDLTPNAPAPGPSTGPTTELPPQLPESHPPEVPQPIKPGLSTAQPGMRKDAPLQDTTPTNDIGFWGRVGAGLGVLGAGIEVGLGAAACYTGIGCIVGGPAILHGADNFQSNLRTLWTGQQVASLTVQGLEAMGVPGAEIINGVVGATLSGGAGAIANAAKAGSMAATTTSSAARGAAGTLKGLGNIGSHSVIDAGTALGAGQKWLGAGYKEIAPGVFRSSDGLRQFRMTNADILGRHGNIGSHVHFEALNDVGKVIENLHLPVTP